MKKMEKGLGKLLSEKVKFCLIFYVIYTLYFLNLEVLRGHQIKLVDF